mmetsp:Transcript_3590/g.11203  ORF Transcript_3590/g.11203 Transcript_3590/m.11203 type:complete len:1311 (+) Transcript_3590:239-4171(+)
MQGYEEEFDDNPFFQLLRRRYSKVLANAQEHRHVVCIPMVGSVDVSTVTTAVVEAHILKWSDDSVTTINGKALEVDGAVLRTRDGFPTARTVQVLFEETFYNVRDESYRVVCIDRPITGEVLASQAVELETLPQCDAFLWRVRHDRKVRSRIQGLFQQFEDAWVGIHDSKGSIGLAELGDAANAVYTRAMQIVLSQSTHRKMKSSKSHMESLRLAIEVFVLHGVSFAVNTALSTIYGAADAALNRQTRALADLDGAALGLPEGLTLSLPDALEDVQMIQAAATPTAKLQCVERAVTTLTKGSGLTISADELIPLLSLLVIHSGIPNWTAILRFIEQFQLHRPVSQQLRYMQVSLEGALTHVGAGGLTELGVMGRAPSRTSCDDLDSEMERYWRAVQADDAKTVAGVIGQSQLEPALCHPLCDCDKCVLLRADHEAKPSTVTLATCDDLGRTALHAAARAGAAEVVSALIELGADVDARDQNESTPLHLSCREDQVNCTLILLQQGADRNTVNADGDTPLHFCAMNGHERCAKAFFFDDSDNMHVNIRNNTGLTPLHLAARWGYGPIVALLLMHGAERTVRNSRGQTPAQMSCNQHIINILGSSELSAATTEFMQSFAISQSPLSFNEEEGPSPAADGDNAVAGSAAPMCDEESNGPRRRNSLSWFGFRTVQDEETAVVQSDEELARRQIDLGVFLDAIEGGDANFVRRIIMVKQSRTNVSPPRAKAALANETAKCHPLCQCDKCIRLGGTISEKATVEDLIMNPNADGFNAIHVAALHGQTEILQILVRTGCSPNYPTTTAVTPLHCAAQYNHCESVRRLMSLNANPDLADANGNTPLHFCAQNGHIDTAKLLLSGVVVVDAQNNRGDTPLHNATRWNDAELVEELIKQGASVDIPNKVGKTAVDLARGKEIAAVFNQDEKAVSTEILVCHIQPPLFHLNGRYIQIGLMPRGIYGGRAASGADLSEKLPVFQRRDAAPRIAGDGWAGVQAVMYYDGGREAWVLAKEVGSEEVLAFACTQADHPAVNTSAWSVATGGGGFRIDIDVDIVGIDGSVATDEAFSTLKGMAWRAPEAAPADPGKNGVSADDAVGSNVRGLSPMADALSKIREADIKEHLDEVETRMISDRSSPQIDARLATLFSICRFDRESLQSTDKNPKKLVRRKSMPSLTRMSQRSPPSVVSMSPIVEGIAAAAAVVTPTSTPPRPASIGGAAISPPIPITNGRMPKFASMSSLDGGPPDFPASRVTSGAASPQRGIEPATPLNYKRDSEMIEKLKGLPSLSAPIGAARFGFDEDPSISCVVLPSPPPNLV